MYFNNQSGVCDYVLSLTDTKYDVGFEKQADGGYVPIFDLHANYVGSQLAASCPMPKSEEGRAQHAIGKLMNSYTRHAAINAATAQGYFVENSFIDDAGNHQLVFASY